MYVVSHNLNNSPVQSKPLTLVDILRSRFMIKIHSFALSHTVIYQKRHIIIRLVSLPYSFDRGISMLRL